MCDKIHSCLERHIWTIQTYKGYLYCTVRALQPTASTHSGRTIKHFIINLICILSTFAFKLPDLSNYLVTAESIIAVQSKCQLSLTHWENEKKNLSGMHKKKSAKKTERARCLEKSLPIVTQYIIQNPTNTWLE